MDRTRNSFSPVVFDADAAATSELAAFRRARTSVADADMAYRVDVIDRYREARRGGDEFAELAVLAEAVRYDQSLADELLGMSLEAVA